ncbi:MAG TPA: EamA family transporter [Candidatus Saccharimonadales bacterium]|nr:EamA family transporter [Candidatus Saccharimonadales bacterium]
MSWIVAGLLSAVFASLVAIFGKVGLKGIDTTLATSVRATVMAVFLIGFALIFGKLRDIHLLTGRPLVFIILSGLAGAISWLFYFYALKNGPAGGVAALDRLSVVFVVVFAAMFLAEALTWKTALGTVLITLGAILFTLK